MCFNSIKYDLNYIYEMYAQGELVCFNSIKYDLN